MDAKTMTRGELEREFEGLARTMYFTKETIAAFRASASRGQLAAVCGLIADVIKSI